ncbi:MAG TPA: glycosyltransferase family 39 protein [Pirellulaceae bacterium]|nr:glycosyltransferase family 39 protein [Pirellulaceae bacterium]
MAKSAQHLADDPTRPWIVAGVAGLLTGIYLIFFLAWGIGGPESSLTRLGLFRLLLLPEEVFLNATAGGGWQGTMDRGFALSAAAAFLWCALWLGWWPLKWIAPAGDWPRWERGVIATAVGLHLISLLTLLVGLVGLLPAPVLAVMFTAAGIGLPVVALIRARRRVKGVGSLFRSKSLPIEESLAEKDSRPRWLWIALCAVATIFAIIILLGGALPPWDFDVLEYHLQVPKEWYLAGRIEFMPHNIYANMPLGAEMFPLAAMSICGDWWLGAIVGKTIMGSCSLLTAAAVYGIVRRMASPTAAMIASLIWLSHPWAMHVSISGLNEQVYSLYLTCAVSAISVNRGTLRNWLLAGLFAGAAAACKYPAVVMLGIPLAAWAVIAPRLESISTTTWRIRLAALTCFVIAAALSGGAWYARNAVQAGNPVYPLLGNLLGGQTRTPEKNEQFARGHAVPPYTLGKLIESALRVVWQSEHQSPLLIPLMLIGASAVWRMTNDQAPMTNGRSLVIGAWSLVISFLATWWLFTHRLDRFLVPAIPLAAIIAGAGVQYALRQPLKWVLYPLLVIGLVYNLVYVSSPMPLAIALAGDNRWLAPLEALRKGELSERVPVSRINADVRWLNANVPPGKAVLCIGEAAVFDLEMPVYYHTCFDDCLLVEWMAGKTAAERKQLLHDRQVAFVYVDWAEIERYRAPGNYGFDPRFSRALLDELVAQGVLAPPLKDAPSEIYSVLP